MKKVIHFLSLLVSLSVSKVDAGNIVIIGNKNVPQMDVTTVQKVYTGKVVSVSDINVTPVAAKTGAPIRNRFLNEFMSQDEEKYTGYWTVRRYVGKGTPPNELENTEAVVNFVKSTAGAVGYVDEADLKEGMNVVGRK